VFHFLEHHPALCGAELWPVFARRHHRRGLLSPWTSGFVASREPTDVADKGHPTEKPQGKCRRMKFSTTLFLFLRIRWGPLMLTIGLQINARGEWILLLRRTLLDFADPYFLYPVHKEGASQIENDARHSLQFPNATFYYFASVIAPSAIAFPQERRRSSNELFAALDPFDLRVQKFEPVGIIDCHNMMRRLSGREEEVAFILLEWCYDYLSRKNHTLFSFVSNDLEAYFFQCPYWGN
jgi:hypothetical protein